MSQRTSGGANGIGTGSASILMIFILLCLTCFATLSLLSAQADNRLTARAAQGVQDYYAADSRAEEILAALETARLAGEDALAEACAQYGVQRQDGGLLAYDLPVDGRKTLHVELLLPEDGGPLQRLAWLELPPEQLEEPIPPKLFTGSPVSEACIRKGALHAAQ